MVTDRDDDYSYSIVSWDDSSNIIWDNTSIQWYSNKNSGGGEEGTGNQLNIKDQVYNWIAIG